LATNPADLRWPREVAVHSSQPFGKPLAPSLRSVSPVATEAEPAVIRVLPGEHFATLDERSQTALFRQRFTVSGQSNRMGSRLQGEPLTFADTREAERCSQPVAPGTVQLPPAGEPIVLLADSQTVGGYPVILHVIQVDMARMAQVRPGKTIIFSPVTLAAAHALFARRMRELRHLQVAIRLEVGG
jgi:antagonist of KipI